MFSWVSEGYRGLFVSAECQPPRGALSILSLKTTYRPDTQKRVLTECCQCSNTGTCPVAECDFWLSMCSCGALNCNVRHILQFHVIHDATGNVCTEHRTRPKRQIPSTTDTKDSDDWSRSHYWSPTEELVVKRSGGPKNIWKGNLKKYELLVISDRCFAELVWLLMQKF